jgi:5,6-dimethylbenzimidazole synthase
MENPRAAADIAASERDALYNIIAKRRDIRREFLPDPIADDKLARILQAAHQAPSVGFMQPWNFILIESLSQRQRILDCFEKANAEAVAMFDTDKQGSYRNFKLQGILDAPLNICITCNRTRTGEPVIGRTHMPEMDLYSTVCAVQNLWLAARAENLGVGWVSIFDKQALRELLGLPPHIEAVAYLCIGHVSHFRDKPEFESSGWLPRLPLSELVYSERWQAPCSNHALIDALKTKENNTK